MQDGYLAVAGSLLLALLVAGTAVAATQLGFAGVGLGGDGAAFEESGLASFVATDPTCADALSDNSSTVARPADGGTRVSINDTVAVETRDSRVDADFREVGPGRYVLDVARRPGDEPADCRLEVRYDATLNLTESTGYTVVLTYDDELKGVQWSDPGAAGASRSVSDGDSGGASAGGIEDASAGGSATGGSDDSGGNADAGDGNETGNGTTETPALGTRAAG